MKLEVRNSYCKFSGEIPTEVQDLIKTILTYRNDIDAELASLFPKLNYAKRINNNKMYYMLAAQIKKLKASEWVCWFNNNTFPTGHLNIVREALKQLNVPYEEVNYRKIPKNDFILNWNNPPPPLRYYQKDFHEIAVAEGRGVCNAAVGTGKSLMAAHLIKEFAVTTLFVVPSVSLGYQIEKDFKSWFGFNKVQTVTTADVRKNKKLLPIRIVTIQTLASLQKSGELHELLSDVSGIYFDEIHHAGSASYTNLLSEIDHIYYRFGFTGTFLRNDAKSLDMWGVLSNVLFRYPAYKAIQDGNLTPIKVLIHELHGKRSPSYHKEYGLNYCGAEAILNKVKEIIATADDTHQILILVKNKDKAGRIFYEYLQEYGVNCAYISGDDSKEVINSTIRDFNEKKVRVLIGSSVIGEGIDVRSTDHLIMCQGGKSEIVIVQAAGRAVRLFDNKKIAVIHDFDFLGTKYLRKHLMQRQDIYKRNFESSVTRIPS